MANYRLVWILLEFAICSEAKFLCQFCDCSGPYVLCNDRELHLPGSYFNDTAHQEHGSYFNFSGTVGIDFRTFRCTKFHIGSLLDFGPLDCAAFMEHDCHIKMQSGKLKCKNPLPMHSVEQHTIPPGTTTTNAPTSTANILYILGILASACCSAISLAACLYMKFQARMQRKLAVGLHTRPALCASPPGIVRAPVLYRPGEHVGFDTGSRTPTSSDESYDKDVEYDTWLQRRLSLKLQNLKISEQPSRPATAEGVRSARISMKPPSKFKTPKESPTASIDWVNRTPSPGASNNPWIPARPSTSVSTVAQIHKQPSENSEEYISEDSSGEPQNNAFVSFCNT